MFLGTPCLRHTRYSCSANGSSSMQNTLQYIINTCVYILHILTFLQMKCILWLMWQEAIASFNWQCLCFCLSLWYTKSQCILQSRCLRFAEMQLRLQSLAYKWYLKPWDRKRLLGRACRVRREEIWKKPTFKCWMEEKESEKQTRKEWPVRRNIRTAHCQGSVCRCSGLRDRECWCQTLLRSSKARTVKCPLNSVTWKTLVTSAGVVLGALASEAITQQLEEGAKGSWKSRGSSAPRKS